MASGRNSPSAESESEKNLQDELEKAEKAFEAGGAEGSTAFAKKKLDMWKTTPVRIAVVGQSGAGKSAFINTIRCIEDDEDPLFADVDVVECTTEKQPYAFPDNPLITLWDLPGAGTSKFNAAEYAKKFEFSSYDAFVLLSSERFTEIDQMIADEVKRIKKPFFFARTKMDNAMRDQKRKLKMKFDASKTSDHVREDCRKQLGPSSKIFLIANVGDSDLAEEFPGIRFDNMDLTKEITQSLPDLQKAALGKILQCQHVSRI